MVKLSLFNNKTSVLKAEAGALYFALRDPRTPVLAKLLALGVVGYALSPIDVVPDFIPFVGWIDDFLIIGLGLRAVKYLTPPAVWEESKAKALPIEDKIRKIYKRVIWTLVIIWAVLVLVSAAVVILIVRAVTT